MTEGNFLVRTYPVIAAAAGIQHRQLVMSSIFFSGKRLRRWLTDKTFAPLILL
jgi:hypothetical protein